MAEKVYFRMSELGYCPRALVSERLRIPSEEPPPWLQTAANEGKRHEQWIKDDLRDEGYVVEDCKVCPKCLEMFGEKREGIHVEFETDNFIAIGHTDGRVHKDGLSQGLEIKSMSQYEFDRWMRGGFQEFPQYAAQITFYMTADPHESWLYIAKNRSSGYKQKGILAETPANIDELTERTNLTAEYIRRGVLPDGEFDSNSIECKRCLFKKNCIPILEELDPMTEAKLKEATLQWRTGENLIKNGKNIKNKALEVFELHSQAVGMDKWRFNDLSITYVHVKGSLIYPKENLLAIFTEDQLKPASKVKDPYDFIRVADIAKSTRQEEGDAILGE